MFTARYELNIHIACILSLSSEGQVQDTDLTSLTSGRTFWSPKRICRRAFLETFIRQRNIRSSSPGPVALRTSSVWIAWWSCLSMMSYTLSPCISKSSCNKTEHLKRIALLPGNRFHQIPYRITRRGLG